jgi:hypothetical protein
MDTNQELEMTDLLDDILSRVGGDRVQETLRSLQWPYRPSMARTQVLFVAIVGARTAWRVLVERTNDEYREGHELALWLRKLVEQLATLVCFGERDDPRDYWLWRALMQYYEVRRLTTGLEEELSITPTADQVASVIDLLVPSSGVFGEVRKRYVGTGAAAAPWFMTQAHWEPLLAGEVDIVDRWRPPRIREILDRAQTDAHPVEISVMGHYQLAYGRYSGPIHAQLSGETILGPPLEKEALWLSIATMVHRVSALVGHRQADAQRLVSRTVASNARHARFDGPPQVGERVALIEGGHACVVKVTRDATVALVRCEPDDRLEVRRSTELPRVP